MGEEDSGTLEQHRKFTKIKFDGEQVDLAWEECDGADTQVTKFTSTDAPAPEFREALQAFVPGMLQLLSLPSGYSVGMTVRGVSISWGDDLDRGLVITALKELAGTDAPLVLNTPHQKECLDLDLDGNFLSNATLERLDTLVAQAERYLAGHRAQGDLFEGNEAA